MALVYHDVLAVFTIIVCDFYQILLSVCKKNPQSPQRKPNYHSKYGKNCHKILFVYVLEQFI